MTVIERIRVDAELDDKNIGEAFAWLERIEPGSSIDYCITAIRDALARTLVEVEKLRARIDDLELSGSDSEELEVALTCETCGVLHKVECKGLGR